MGADSNIQSIQPLPHCSVLLNEVLEYLVPLDNKTYLDCTFGAGGYSRAVLEKANCFVIGLDQDPNVLPFANQLYAQFGNRFEFVQTNFADSKDRLLDKKFDGIILDLGVSSMQVDNADRGFSFMQEGPLDMRMSSSGMTVAEFIANTSEEEIANVIYKYGEEVQSRQIAKKIVEARARKPLKSTLQFAEIIRNAMHYRKSKIDPVTKTFQAIRIFINKELESLELFLKDIKDMLKPRGRIIVVSFHSLEDSIVKYFFKNYSIPKIARSKYSKELNFTEKGKWLKIITKKSISPKREEVLKNPRSRSARLRVAEKLGGPNIT